MYQDMWMEDAIQPYVLKEPYLKCVSSADLYLLIRSMQPRLRGADGRAPRSGCHCRALRSGSNHAERVRRTGRG